MLPATSGKGKIDEEKSVISTSSNHSSPESFPRPVPAFLSTDPCTPQSTSLSLTYTSFYCEENVYFLCKHLSSSGIADTKSTDLFAVFISNDEKQVPLLLQKTSKRSDGLVLWDYHVICIQSRRYGKGCVQHLVWDLDSSLSFPVALDEYIAETLRPSLSSVSMLQRYFRVIHAPMFLPYFGSDRSHMKDFVGNWLSPPPDYDPIIAEDGTVNNINEYISIHASDEIADMSLLVDSLFNRKLGVVVREERLLDLFALISNS